MRTDPWRQFVPSNIDVSYSGPDGVSQALYSGEGGRVSYVQCCVLFGQVCLGGDSVHIWLNWDGSWGRAVGCDWSGVALYGWKKAFSV